MTRRALSFLLAAVAMSGSAMVRSADLVDSVDPMIGAITLDGYGGHGLGKTFPGAATPFGMVQLSPDTITGGDNGPGYSHHHGTIEGFSFTHMSGIGYYGDFGNIQVMPTTGPRILDREQAASAFDHSNETVRAGYYSVMLDRYGVRVELTAAPRSGVMRMAYPAGVMRRVQIDLGRRIGQRERWLAHSRQSVRVVDDRTIAGTVVCDSRDGGWGRGEGMVNYRVSFRIAFSEPFVAFGAADKGSETEGRIDVAGSNVVWFAEFAPSERPLELRGGVSFVDEDGAARNLDADRLEDGFDAVAARARRLWADELSRVSVEGGTARERTVFATALYHAMIDPRTIADADGRRRRADGTVCGAGSFTARTVFSGWDVFRSEFPLLCVIRPDVVDDTINSMSDVMASGARDTLPVWDIFGCASGCMIGNPLLPVLAEATAAGVTNWNRQVLWEQAEATSLRRGNAACGWTPDSLSETLEYAFDDACMAVLAKRLGHPERIEYYARRAQWYRNAWSSEVGWMRSRRADGTWLEWKGREVHNQGTVESNPWQQGWFVPHDVRGLIALAGGDDAFASDLEDFFSRTPEDFLWNDGYNHPNEQCHHVAFLFPYCGRPWLTQKWTREICSRAYGTGVRGLCGNEDVGQMSAWYVLAAVGMHPVAPGSGVWILTAPVFSKATLRLDPLNASGETFTIAAPGASAVRRYVVGATLNGRRLDRAWITSGEILGGGTLELTMSEEPDKGAFKVRPPDMADEFRERTSKGDAK